MKRQDCSCGFTRVMDAIRDQERERCARIAEAQPTSPNEPGPNLVGDQRAWVKEQIAKKIREGA